MTNSIPNLFPISVYEERKNEDFPFTDNERESFFTSYAKAVFPKNSSLDKDLDKLYFTRLVSKTKDSYCRQSTSSQYFNTLNFFSAADLSQCQYMFIVISDLPMKGISCKKP